MSSSGGGYLTGNMLIPFPFEDGQCLGWGSGVDRGTAQRSLERCFVDASIVIDGTVIPDGEWPSVGRFRVTDGVLSFSIAACGGSVSLSAPTNGGRFPILSGKAPWGYYTIVLSSDGIDDFVNEGFTPPYAETEELDDAYWLRLCVKCIDLKHYGLSSIRVYDGIEPAVYDTSSSGYAVGDACRHDGLYYVCMAAVGKGSSWNAGSWNEVSLYDLSPSFILKGDIRIEPGNNIVITEPDDVNGMTISASPGAGMGRIPCSCPEVAETSAVMSRDGNARIFNDTCYDLEPSIVDGVGYINIHAKCTACCTCSMYESIVNSRLAPLAASIRAAKSSLADDLAVYEQAVMKFNERLDTPSVEDVSLSLSGMPVGKNLASSLTGNSLNVSGRMGRCAFTAAFRNSSYSVMTVRIESMTGTDSIAESSAIWSDEDGEPLSVTVDGDLSDRSFKVYPGRSLIITFISVRSDMVSGVTTGGYEGAIAAAVSYVTPSGVSGSLGTLSKSVEV